MTARGTRDDRLVRFGDHEPDVRRSLDAGFHRVRIQSRSGSGDVVQRGQRARAWPRRSPLTRMSFHNRRRFDSGNGDRDFRYSAVLEVVTNPRRRTSFMNAWAAVAVSVPPLTA